MKKKILTSFLAVATLLGLIALALPDENNEQLAAAVSRDVMAVARGKVDVEGGIVHVAASRQGIVETVLVEEGDRVSKGQVLARMDARQPQLSLDVIEAQMTEARKELASLQLKLSQAKRDLGRMESLVTSSAVSRQRYDRARDAFLNLSAEAELQRARMARIRVERDVQAYEVEQFTIKAPLDGRIARRMAQPGQGTSTLEVTDLFLVLPEEEPIIRAEVEERFIRDITPDTPVIIVPEEDESLKAKGTIRRIGQIMGSRKNVAMDPTDKVDVRVVEVVISYSRSELPLMIGQRVIVKFRNDSRGDG